MQKDNFTFRKMTPSDVDEVSLFESRVLDGWSKENIAQSLNYEANNCFVAIDEGGTICAFCVFAVAGDTCNLDALSVAQSHRRKGVANRLLLFAMNFLKQNNINTCFLEVRSENTGAIALYKQLNFKQNGLRKNFYSKPSDDALLFYLALN